MARLWISRVIFQPSSDLNIETRINVPDVDTQKSDICLVVMDFKDAVQTGLHGPILIGLYGLTSLKKSMGVTGRSYDCY